MSSSLEKKGAPKVFQTSPNLGDDIDLLETKLLNDNNISPNNSNNSSMNNQNPTITLSNLSSEMLIHRRKQEILSHQIKSCKSLYNQQLKQYKTLTQSIIQLENNVDNIHLQITSIKKRQMLILENITDDNFQYLLEFIPRIKDEIYEGFLSFVNHENYKKEQIPFILKSKTNLINLLENAFSYFELIFSLSKNQYYSTKNKIEMIQSNNNIEFPFEQLYEYFKYSFDLIDQTEEYNIMHKKIIDLNNEKNKRFIELKSLENEILKKDLNLQNLIKYINNINTLIEKTKNTNNNEILNHKLLSGFSECKIGEDQSQINNEYDIDIIKTNKKEHKTNPKRNVNLFNVNQQGHHKHSSLTHSSMANNTNNVFGNVNSQIFSATVKIKPITTLSLNTNNNSNHKKKKSSDINKKNTHLLTNPSTMIPMSLTQKNAKKQQAYTTSHHNKESNLLNIVTAPSQENNNNHKTQITKKVNTISGNIITNFKTEPKEHTKNISKNSAINTQSTYTTSVNATIAKAKTKKCSTNYGKNQINTFNKINSTKKGKTRNNSPFTKQLLTLKQKPTKIKNRILNRLKPALNSNSNQRINSEQHNNENTTHNITENKNATDVNNLTDQSENYNINTQSKDSINISDIDSVCDELQVFPLSLIPGTFNNNLFVNNDTNTISSNVNNHNNNNYMQNSYILMQRNRDINYNNNSRKGGIPNIKNNFVNFKIEKPIPAGGCCVSCT